MTRLPLAADTPHSLADASGQRWPVVDGVPYLRVGRADLIETVLGQLDAGEVEGALVDLLRDADDWWDEPPPAREDVRRLLGERDRIGLRDAMAALGFGRVGTYFAHRWTDPTYLAGLGLIAAHWTGPGTAFELACGIGHYLRALRAQGAVATGADVVFAKLWIARQYVVPPDTTLLCFDAGAPWPVDDVRFDLVLCQDAFYFLEPKATVLAGLRRAVGEGGTLLVGHIHNSAVGNHSAGAALSAAAMASLFPGAVTYEDGELTRAVAAGRVPVPSPLASLTHAEAFAVAEGPDVTHPVDFVPCGPTLRRNPLYVEDPDGWTIAWPSQRYRDEYARLATYPMHHRGDAPTLADRRTRAFVDLPERW